MKNTLLKILAISGILILILIILSSVQVKPGYSTLKPTKISGDDDKPAEEVYKNIQSLKGMPAGDLGKVMQFMRASLNVKCGFCHVRNADNTWNFASDSLEEKNTAREMINMVKNINDVHFGGSTAITCFTCHNGHTHPQRTPSLPQTVPQDFTHEESGNMPDANTVFENYKKSQGINDYSTIKTKYSKGTSALWDGKSYPIEIYQKAPDKFLSILTAPDGSKIYRGYDGNTGWTKSNGEVKLVDGPQLETLKQFADFYSQINPAAKYTDIRMLGTDTAYGNNYYVLRATINDKKTDRVYISVDSGLLLRITTYTKSILGNIPERLEYTNYSNVNGIMTPMTIEFSYLDPWAEVTRNYSEVKFNEKMDDGIFTLPRK